MQYPHGIDVVVVNYRTPADLSGFLNSLYAHPPSVSFTVTVVNVEPLPEDVEVGAAGVGLFAHGNHVVLSENVGYGRACNRGALLGNHSILSLFNADVLVTEDALDQCVRALTVKPTWGVLGPRQVDLDNRLTAAGILGTGEEPRHRGWMAPDRGQYNDIRTDAVTVSGAAYFIKRQVWDQLTGCELYRRAAPEAEGAFLPTPHYYEETMCSYHARAHGWAVVYFGPACVVHHWHRASPLYGPADRLMPVSRELFRAACDLHSIPHD